MGDILSCFFSFVLIRYILELTGCVTISCFVKFSFEHSYPVFYLKWHFTRKHVRMIWSYSGWHDWNLFHHETHIHYLRLTSEPWGWRWPIRGRYWFTLTNQRPRLVTGVRREREGGWEELSVSLCPSTIHGPKSSNAQTPPKQDTRAIPYRLFITKHDKLSFTLVSSSSNRSNTPATGSPGNFTHRRS